MDEADEVAPREALLDRSERTLAVNTPDLVQDGFESTAVLVNRPQFHLGMRKGRRHLPQQGAQTSLELVLGQQVSLHMAGPWLQPASTEPAQVAPTELTADVVTHTLG